MEFMHVQDRVRFADPQLVKSYKRRKFFLGVMILAAGILGIWLYYPQDIVAVIIGVIFILAGLTYVGSRGETVYVRSRGEIERSWGIFLILSRSSTPIIYFDKVEVQKEIRHQSFRYRTVACDVFVVRLLGQQSIDIADTLEPLKARRLAERAAKILKLPFHDERFVLPSQHPNSKITVEQRADSVVLTFPKPPPLSLQDTVIMVFMLGFLYFVYYAMHLLSIKWPIWVELVFFGLFAIAILVPLVKVVFRAVQPRRVVLHQEGITVGSSRTKEFNKHDIETVSSREHAITVASDQQQVTIHVYADSKDVQFVQDFIRYYMTK